MRAPGGATPSRKHCLGASPGAAWKAGGASSAEAKGFFQAQLPSTLAAGLALAFSLSHVAL